MRYTFSKERVHYYAPGNNVVMRLVIEKSPLEEEMREAIGKVVARHEILNCKVCLDEDGVSYYEPMKQPTYLYEVISDISKKDTTDYDWRKLIKEHERMPFDFTKGELIRFIFIKEKEQSQLLIVAHHLAGDGKSMLYLIRDIMTALGEPDCNMEFSPIKVFDKSFVPEDVKLNPLIRVMTKLTNRNWNKNKKIFSYEEYLSMFQSYWENRYTTVVGGSITGKDLYGLIRKCKEHKISLNSAIVTAFLLAVQVESEVGLAASVRPVGLEGMANYATGISIRYHVNKNESFWECASKVHKLIYKKLNNNSMKYFILEFMGSLEPTLIDAAYFSAFADYNNKIAGRVRDMFGYNNNPKGISITNLTQTDIPSKYGKYTLKALDFIPPLVPNAKRIIGVVTLEDVMSIQMQYEKKDGADDMRKCVPNAIEILLNS